MPKKSQKTIDKELREDKIRMHEEKAMLRMLNLDKIGDYMLKANLSSFGFLDEDTDEPYFAQLTKLENGKYRITVEKTYTPEVAK